MTETQFALAWDAHKKNICNGLSYLQQNGEFVDMTLAADGHLVKVHQIILALASPYIKELIVSAQCPHPVIFLNRMSYKTLCSILEYIYTGEVLVSSENLNQLIEAGRELHIKGLEDMDIEQTMDHATEQYPPRAQSQNEDDVCFYVTDVPDKDNQLEMYASHKDMDYNGKQIILNTTIDNVRSVDESFIESLQEEDLEDNNANLPATESIISDGIDNRKPTIMQYTVSNQGSLQMILNRFVYYLKHTNRNNSRQWRCVDYVTSIKCPAHVVTKDDVVLHRIAAHTHPFHDKKILKKVHAGAIFSAIQEAEKQGHAFGSKKLKSRNKTDNNDGVN